MPTPYDLTAFFAAEVASTDVIFIHLASRTLTLTEGLGTMDQAPDTLVTAKIIVGGVEVADADVQLFPTGQVVVNLPTPIALSPGQVIRVVADANADDATTPAEDVALTFVGQDENNAVLDDDRYDVANFNPGVIGYNQVLLLAVAPRAFNIDGGRLSMGSDQVTGPFRFSIQKNGVEVGAIIIEDGDYTILLDVNPTGFAKEDTISVVAPAGDEGVALSLSLFDIAISFTGHVL